MFGPLAPVMVPLTVIGLVAIGLKVREDQKSPAEWRTLRGIARLVAFLKYILFYSVAVAFVAVAAFLSFGG